MPIIVYCKAIKLINSMYWNQFKIWFVLWTLNFCKNIRQFISPIQVCTLNFNSPIYGKNKWINRKKVKIKLFNVDGYEYMQRIYNHLEYYGQK